MNLQPLLEKYQTVFDQIQEHCEMFKEGVYSTPSELRKVLLNLTGLYGSINIVFKSLEAEKLNEEVREYTQIKIDTEKTDKKFVSAAAEKEASHRVAELRRARNLFEGYVQVCQTSMMNCQSVLKSLSDELRNLKE